MKHHRFILISAALLLLVGFIFFLTHLAEPTYEGKTLTAWLKQLDAQSPGLQIEDSGESQPPATAQAMNAIRAIGTNGIPTLLNLMQAKDNAVLKRVEKMINRIGFPYFRFPSAFYKRRLAQWGFAVLGRQARPAASDLMQIVRTAQQPGPGLEALYCLECLKLDDRTMTLYLMDTLGNTNHSISGYAATRLTFRYRAIARKADLYKEYSPPTPEPNTPPTNNSPVSNKNIFPRLTNPSQPDPGTKAKTEKP